MEGDVIPYTPEALEKKKKNYEARATADPRLKCWTLGTPRGIYYPEPFQVFQRAQDLTLMFEFGDSVRTIHTDGTLHPVETDHEFWLGDSRGHWEGDTLVVDVRDFNDQTWLSRAGDFHDEALHVVELARIAATRHVHLHRRQRHAAVAGPRERAIGRGQHDLGRSRIFALIVAARGHSR